MLSAADVIARRGQKLSERLPRTCSEIRAPVRGHHEVLPLPERKGDDSLRAAWRDVHTTHRRLVREHRLAARRASA